MRALSIDAWGGLPVVRDVPEPPPAAGRAFVRVLRASINPVDLAIGAGRFYMPLPDPPFTPGAEVVGEVIASDAHPAGTRVWCLPITGGLAEVVSAPEESLVPVPEDVPDGLAVALGIAGLAGWMPVLDRGALVPGETVVVLGASGVVGQVAVQAARSAGAARIVAVARSATGRDRAIARGADVALATGPDLAAALREACPEGADLVIDPLWGDSALAAIGVLRRRGRLVQVGNAEGPAVAMAAGPLRGGLLDIRGFSVLVEDHERVRSAYSEICAAALAGEVALDIDEVSLDGAPAAWQRQASGAGGRKAVVAIA